jgi:hypothetical protein
MYQYLKEMYYRCLYIILRLVNNNVISVVKLFSSENSLESDSQKTNYEASVEKIINTEFSFDNFRRSFSYCEIVENVTHRQGLAYASRIESLTNGGLVLKVGNQNDIIGNPIRFKYPVFGKISPTTLRYISVALEIKNKFGPNLSGEFVEIGGGYGGQISILKDYFRINNYGVYDLHNVQSLIKKYLESIDKIKDIKFLNLETSEKSVWDLVISNYAFSELPKELQEIYIDKSFIEITKRLSNNE